MTPTGLARNGKPSTGLVRSTARPTINGNATRRVFTPDAPKGTSLVKTAADVARESKFGAVAKGLVKGAAKTGSDLFAGVPDTKPAGSLKNDKPTPLAKSPAARAVNYVAGDGLRKTEHKVGGAIASGAAKVGGEILNGLDPGAARKKAAAQAAKPIVGTDPKGPYAPKTLDKTFPSAVDQLTNGRTKTDRQTGTVSKGFNSSDPTQVQDLQRFLVNRGYNLSVDGQFGPRTKSAMENFQLAKGDPMSSRNPKAWNASFATPGNVNTAPNAKGAQDSLDPVDVKKAKPLAKKVDLASSMNSVLANLAASSANWNPAQMAQNFANAKDDTGINAQQALLHLTGAQNDQNKTDIQNWFSDLVKQNNANNGTDTTALNGALDATKADASQLAGVLTDPEAQKQLLQSANYNVGNLRAIGNIEGDYNRNYGDALALRGKDELVNQTNKQDNAMAGLRAQLIGLIQQKGADLATAKDGYTQQGIQNNTNLYNVLASAAYLPAKISSSILSQAKTKAEIAKLLNPPTKNPKVNVEGLANQIAALYGVGSDFKLPKGINIQDVANSIGTVMQGSGLQSGSPLYKNIGNTIATKFLYNNGSPVTTGPSWFNG